MRRLGLVLVLALSACHHAPAAPASTAPAAPTAAGDPRSETIGGIQLGDASAKVVTAIGEPATRAPIVEEGATGEFVSTWTWPALGLALGMSSGTADGPLAVRSISIEAPSKLTTSRGVGIGTPRADVEKQYQAFAWKEGDEGPPPSADEIVVGTVYGGTIFHFGANQQVTSVFVGAAAE